MQPEHVHSPEEYAFFFRRGEERGFAWFFRQFYPPLSYFAAKITGDVPSSEEIVSGAFLKIWQRHHQFSSPEGIKAYLYQIVRNDALKWIQKNRKRSAVYKEAAYLLGTGYQKDHFQWLVTAESTRELWQTVDTLPPQCRRVFHLLYFEGKSVKETAQELNLSPSTVKTQKSIGLKLLKTRIAGILPVLIVLLSSYFSS